MRKSYIFFSVIFLSLLALPPAGASPRQEVLNGPVTGEVMNVLDGDTVNARVHVWIGQDVETSIRIAGIDAPEIKGKCEKERALAEQARQTVIRLLNDSQIQIYNIRLEKYAGRVMAQVQTADGIDIGKYMIEKGLARPYHGEKRRSWCAKTG
jgi:endonuclease YncB( thermonuclease family)